MSQDPPRTIDRTQPLTDDERSATHLDRPAKRALLVFYGDVAQLATLAPGRPLVIGREGPADVPIPDPSLSKRHAQFEVREDGVWVEDLGSTNGTQLNGEAIAGPRLVFPGDEIRMGAAIAFLHARETAPASKAALLGHDAFELALEEEALRTKELERKLALVYLEVEGPAHTAKVIDAIRAGPGLRSFERAGRYSDTGIEVMLPEKTAVLAGAWAEALLAALEPQGLVPRIGIAVFPDSATNGDDLISRARETARRTTRKRPIEVAPGIASRTISEPSERALMPAPIFAAASMQAVFDSARRIARSTIPVLVQGETGAGKELVARAVHEAGPRSEKPLLAINCGAINPTLLESTLFGHVEGAFTGAVKTTKGLFESAHGGTIFLDEIGELTPAAQVALLRVLETKRVVRVGSQEEIAVDVRVVAATHRDLEVMSEEGSFRKDLMYRLNAMVIRVPPLRDRAEDIIPLAYHFLEEANRSNGTRIRSFDPEALKLMCAYAWPGNVRELKNAVERAVANAQDAQITLDDLPERVQVVDAGRRADDPRGRGGEPSFEDGEDYKAIMRRLESGVLLEALRRAGGNQTEAARRLKMPRRTFIDRMNKLNLKKLGYGPGD